MLTFRSFTTPIELFNLLKKRFLIETPEGADPKEFESRVRGVIRLRYVSFFTVMKVMIASWN